MHNANAILRERLFTMRMSEEEWQRASAVAAHFGLNLASLFRMLAREKARELGLEVNVPPPAPSSRPRAKTAKSATKKR